MKKNLLAVLLLTMLVGVAHAWPTYCRDFKLTGESLCTTTNGDCSIQVRPRFECVWGGGPTCVPYDPNAQHVKGSYQPGVCHRDGFGAFRCYADGMEVVIYWMPLC
jgi:hypothetical protein